VPNYARRYYYCFGGITFFLFLLQLVTGALLTLYYVPEPGRAYASVFYISNFVSYGWLIRSIHHWSANLMVIFVLLHMLRVYLTGAYKHPREFNWITGVVLLLLVMTFAFTGYLLPWDQKAYWGSTVGISFIERIPFIGKTLAYILMGGEKIGGPTLTRFFSLHTMLLPAFLIIFLIGHFWMIRKQGISGPL
jgi:quinol-cytochrome oxidoreductase complex cytochrome b subunit